MSHGSEFTHGLMAGLGGCIDGAIKESLTSQPDFQQEYPAAPENPSDSGTMKTVILSAWFTLACYQGTDAQFRQSLPYRQWMAKTMLEYARENMLLRDYGCRFTFSTSTKPDYVPGGRVKGVGGGIYVVIAGIITPVAINGPERTGALPTFRVNLGEIRLPPPSPPPASAAANEIVS